MKGLTIMVSLITTSKNQMQTPRQRSHKNGFKAKGKLSAIVEGKNLHIHNSECM